EGGLLRPLRGAIGGRGARPVALVDWTQSGARGVLGHPALEWRCARNRARGRLRPAAPAGADCAARAARCSRIRARRCARVRHRRVRIRIAYDESTVRKRFYWKLKAREIPLGERTVLLGVLNVTPDSFSDGGKYSDPDRAFARAMELEEEGADVIDIG